MKKLKVPVSIGESASDIVWHKILWNAVLNSSAAVTGMDVPAMANSESILPLFNAIADEYFAVSEKMGIKMKHPRNFVELLVFAAKAAGRIKSVSPPKPSMLQDIEAGRPTEIEFINGAIVAEGEKLGVPTPVNKTMVALVKTIEGKSKS
jgi:2-dehydropantoate 2-reductase